MGGYVESQLHNPIRMWDMYPFSGGYHQMPLNIPLTVSLPLFASYFLPSGA